MTRPAVSVPAVVIGLGVNGLGVVRSLGRAGVPVIGFYTRTTEAGRVSRYCEARRLSPLGGGGDAALQELIEFGERLDRPPLFPTSDEAVQFVSDHRSRLASRFRFLLPDRGVLDRIIDKEGTRELAVRAGIPVPTTRTPRDRADVLACCEEMVFPCILKPTNTFSVRMPDQAKNVVLQERAELPALLDRHPELVGQVVLQEIIRGGDGRVLICAAYLDASSDPLAIYTGRKLRQYLPDYGVTCFGQSADLPEVAELTVRFLRSIEFKGLVTAEFVEDRRDGKLYFVELNARSYYHNILFTDCGVNLPWVAYRDLVGAGAAQERPRQQFGLRWLDLQKDLGSFWRKWKRDEITLGAYLRSILGARSFAYLDRRDLRPFFYSTWLFARLLLEKIAQPLRRA